MNNTTHSAQRFQNDLLIGNDTRSNMGTHTESDINKCAKFGAFVYFAPYP